MSTAVARTFRPETFTVSRALDFLIERELTRQIGHGSERWPLVVVKELTDNALDDAEEAQLPPRIEVTVNEELIEVRDHGSGKAARYSAIATGGEHRMTDSRQHANRLAMREPSTQDFLRRVMRAGSDRRSRTRTQLRTAA